MKDDLDQVGLLVWFPVKINETSLLLLAAFQADDVTPTKLTKMGADITNGLAYLAEMNFVHRYVKKITFIITFINRAQKSLLASEINVLLLFLLCIFRV